MAAPWQYALFAAVSLAALLGGMALGTRIPKRRAVWVLLPCILAATLYAICRARPDWEATLFPWPLYAFWQRQWIFPPGILIIACCGSMLPVRWNRVFIWAVASGVFGWSMWTGLWMLRPLCPGSTRPPVSGMMVQQSTGYTCAPAACATLLAAWGIEKTEHEMAQLCLCAENRGTSPFDLYRGLALAAEGTGLKARMVKVSNAETARLVCPFAVGANGHAVVIFEVRGDRLLIGDPMRQRASWESFDRIDGGWDNVAVLLCREPPFDGANAPQISAWINLAEGNPRSSPPRGK